MTQRIFKYSLALTRVQGVSMPRNAQILSVQYQEGLLCMWALVDGAAEPVKREICIYGTGHEVFVAPTRRAVLLSYVGTVQQGPFVWHVFDNGEVP